MLKWRWFITVCFLQINYFRSFMQINYFIIKTSTMKYSDERTLSKLKRKNAFIIALLFSLYKHGETLENALRFWLHFFMKWSSKESFEFNIIPSSSFLFLHMMILLTILSLTLSFPETFIWLFPLFLCV